MAESVTDSATDGQQKRVQGSAAGLVAVSKDFLIRVDSYCSLVAHRGWGEQGGPDGETRQQLIRLSLEARSAYEGRA